MAPSVTLRLDRRRHALLMEALSFFGDEQRRRAEREPAVALRAQRLEWGDEADAIRRIAQGWRPPVTELRPGIPLDLQGDRWFVLTESLELWADVLDLETHDGAHDDAETARELVDGLDRQLGPLERRRLMQTAIGKLKAEEADRIATS